MGAAGAPEDAGSGCRPHLLVIAPPTYRLPTISDYRTTHLAGSGLPALKLAILSAHADIALLVIDAAFGLEKRDLWSKALVCLARIPHIVLGIDRLGHHDAARERFRDIGEQFAEQADGIDCGTLHIVPLLNETDSKGEVAAWYDGPTLAELLGTLREQITASEKGQRPEPAPVSDQFAAHLCWNDALPLLPGRNYRFRLGDQRTSAQISALKHRINPETLDHQAATLLRAGDVGYVNISLAEPVLFLPFEQSRAAGHFWLEDETSGKRIAFGLIRHELRRATNIKWHALAIDKTARAASKQQTPCVLWFTGLSGSGKSTVASLIDQKLHALGKHTYLLDGDNIRHGLCRDLGFTDADRVENLRRISETAKLFVDAGLIVLVSFISPFRSERHAARALFGNGEFIEIFVDTPLAVCEARDPKGLYKKARAGQLKNFTGIDSPYEPPTDAEIVLPGAAASAEELADRVIASLFERGLIASNSEPPGRPRAT